MGICETCGNEYDKTFDIHHNGRTHTFDSFECAVHALAPRCAHCGCAIIGHGVEEDEVIYCCEHCANQTDAKGHRDRSAKHHVKSE